MSSSYRGTGEDADTIGTTFRRGDMFVIVLTQYTGDVSEDTAAALAADLTRTTWNGLPAGGTAPYRFPSTPSKLLGLVLTAALVTAAACGSMLIARLRARRVRRHWVGGELPPPEVAGNADAHTTHAGTAISLDHDADRLRRQGASSPSARSWPSTSASWPSPATSRGPGGSRRRGAGGRVAAHPLLAAT